MNQQQALHSLHSTMSLITKLLHDKISEKLIKNDVKVACLPTIRRHLLSL